MRRSRSQDHADLVAELLDRIRREGPLSSTDIEPRASIDWYWRPTNQVRAILEALAEAGILGISRREGNRRIYDLAERLFPRRAARRDPAPARPVPTQAAVALSARTGCSAGPDPASSGSGRCRTSRTRRCGRPR